MLGLNGLRQRFALKTTKQQLAYIKARAFIVGIVLTIISIASIFFFAFFFSIRTKDYYDSIAKTRIENASREIVKNIENTLDDCFYDIQTFENILSETDLKENDSFSLDKLNKRISTYSNEHFLDEVGVIYNNTILFNNTTESIPVLNGYTKQSNSTAFVYEDNVYVVTPVSNTLPVEIEAIVGKVSSKKFTDEIETTMYNSTASIIIANDNGDMLLVSSIKYKDIGGNVLDNMNAGVQRGYPTHDAEYLNGKTFIAEDMVHKDPQMIYHQVLSKSTDTTKYHFILLVPKVELTNAIKNYSTVALSILYSVLAISTAAIILLIYLATRLYIKNRRNEAYDKTGMINYETFIHDVGATLCTSSDSFAIVCVNICDFTKMNTLYGTDIADKLLSDIAHVLTELTDDEGELCGHYRGDKFMLLLRGTKDEIIYKQSVIHSTLNQTDSISSLCPVFKYGLKMTNASKATEVRQEFDCAVFAQKKIEASSKENYYFFDDKMYSKQLEDNELIERFPEAIKNEEFEVYLQLKWDIKKNTWGGAEALVRWRTKDKGLISPGRFIPLFESNGFITELDKYMFEHVCKLISSMLDNGEECVKISLNLSRRNFTDLSFISMFRDVVNEYKTPHNLIEFEITEGLLMDNAENYKTFIKAAHDKGYYVSMDDFGAGFSSLNMINELDFDTIKLDAKFFRGGFDQSNQTIVSSIIDLCHKLGKTVVAEGIEHSNEVEYLRANGCDLIQGYYFAKPVPFEEFKKLLKS